MALDLSYEIHPASVGAGVFKSAVVEMENLSVAAFQIFPFVILCVVFLPLIAYISLIVLRISH